ncbi:MAG: hypothetical protein H6Q69_1145 [Firmicutes bacterium]|nr:hypothetical protein [Bacillota bacterium]
MSIEEKENLLIQESMVKDTPNQNVSTSTANMSPFNFAQLLQNSHCFIKIHSVLHIYDNCFGYYKPLTTGNGDRFIRMITPTHLCSLVNSNFIKETINWLDILINSEATPQALYNSSLCLNFIDGFLDVISDNFYQHDPNMIFTSYIPFTYEQCKYAPESTIFDNWLNEITNNNSNHKALLSQVFGYLISEYRKIKYMPIFFGRSNTGKSIWLSLITAAIGNEFIKSISLHNLTSNFRTAELVGAKANICAEIDQRKLPNIDLIKSLIGGSDKINADVKNGKPIEFVNTAALVFSTNTLDFLKVADPGNALANRLLIIPFNKVVSPDKMDGNFDVKLLEELPRIIYKFAIPGFGLLALNKFKFILDACAELDQLTHSPIDTAVTFLINACKFDNTAKIHTDALYSVYVNYCNQRALSALQKLKFKDLLSNLHFHIKGIAPLTYCEKFRDKGFNRNGFYGIALNTPT